VLAQLFHLGAHLLDLLFQEFLLKLDDFLGVLGADEALREVEGRVNVLLSETDRPAADLARAGLRLFGRSLDGAVEPGRLAHVLIDCLPSLRHGGLSRLADALGRSDRIGRPQRPFRRSTTRLVVSPCASSLVSVLNADASLLISF
jgi:hypothetical protein